MNHLRSRRTGPRSLSGASRKARDLTVDYDAAKRKPRRRPVVEADRAVIVSREQRIAERAALSSSGKRRSKPQHRSAQVTDAVPIHSANRTPEQARAESAYRLNLILVTPRSTPVSA